MKRLNPANYEERQLEDFSKYVFGMSYQTIKDVMKQQKTNVIKERPLSSGASDRKATQSAQPVHRQNVEKVVSQETRQNYTKDRRTKVQQTQTVQKNQQTTEKTRNLVMKKGQKKK